MKKNISLTVLFCGLISLISINVIAENDKNLIERFPTQAIARPGIMPTGIINIDTSIGLSDLKTVGLSFGTKFGIIKNLHGEFGYDGFEFNKPIQGQKEAEAFVAKRTVYLGAKYNYLSIPHISFSASVKLPLYIADGEIVRDFSVGLPVVFYNDRMAGGILDGILSIKMRPDRQMALNFPFWYGLQVYGNWWASVDSSFGNIKMERTNSKNNWETTGFWQAMPARLEVLYAFNNYLDLAGSLGFTDMFKPKDTLNLGLTLSIRGGRLFG